MCTPTQVPLSGFFRLFLCRSKKEARRRRRDNGTKSRRKWRIRRNPDSSQTKTQPSIAVAFWRGRFAGIFKRGANSEPRCIPANKDEAPPLVESLTGIYGGRRTRNEMGPAGQLDRQAPNSNHPRRGNHNIARRAIFHARKAGISPDDARRASTKLPVLAPYSLYDDLTVKHFLSADILLCCFNYVCSGEIGIFRCVMPQKQMIDRVGARKHVSVALV